MFTYRNKQFIENNLEWRISVFLTDSTQLLKYFDVIIAYQWK